jgi:hypothetical protein
VCDGQGGAVEDLLAVEVGDRHLRGGDEEQAVVGLVGVVLELGQLGGADHAAAPHQVRRRDLRVAMLGCGHVEEERDQGPLETGAVAAEHGETRPADLGRAFEVEDAQRLTEDIVGSRFEIELGGRSPGAHNHVVRLVPALRDRGMRWIGHVKQEIVATSLQGGHLGLGHVDALLEVAEG